MSKENVRVVREMFDAYLRKDDRALVGFAHPDVEIKPSWDAITRTVRRGHAGFLEFWHEWEESWDEYFLEPREFHDAGDKVVVVLFERARGRASGAPVEDVFAHVWTVRDGRVVRCEVFGEKHEALAAAASGDRRG